MLWRPGTLISTRRSDGSFSFCAGHPHDKASSCLLLTDATSRRTHTRWLEQVNEDAAGNYTMVLEYGEQSLRELLRNEQLSESRCRTVAERLVVIIRHLHACGVGTRPAAARILPMATAMAAVDPRM